MFVCISSPQSFFCSSWCFEDTEDDKEETSVHRSSPIKVPCYAPTDILVKPGSFVIDYVNPYIAVIKVGEHTTQLFSWC